MFLKKLFKFGKDYNYYLEKGDRYLADERFAEARMAYGEAMEKMEASGGEALTRIGDVRRKISLTGNMLGRLNLVEAEYALAAGDGKKAGEHLRVIMDLADDATLRDQAERLLAAPGSGSPGEKHAQAAHDCAACAGTVGAATDGGSLDIDDNMSAEDRLSLYFHTLPGDLPDRYAAKGEEFGRGCLLNLAGDGEGALRVFEELCGDTEDDILKYEKAIIYYHHGDAGQCEQLLTSAIALNPGNALCNIALAQLYADTGRGSEALQVLERMIAGDLLAEQARLMEGDLHVMLLEEAKAVESYSKLLSSPKFAREAAGRLIPLLEKQGRTREAAYLAKKYAKGCC